MISLDMRTWVEAAVTKYVRDLIPAEQVHVFLVHRLLAQLLWYWRYEVPPKWIDCTVDLDYSVFSSRLQEPALEDVGFRKIDAHISQVYAALDSSDWETVAALPELVWNWITDLTGVSRREWASIPNAVLGLVDQDVVCPDCRKACDLRELGDLVRVTDPFTYHGSGKPCFVCPRCQARLVFDVFDLSGEPRRPQTWNPQAAKRIGLTALGVVAVYLLLRHLVL